MYYVSLHNKYYNKSHGWVDHPKFATQLSYDEAQGLKKIYPDVKIQSQSCHNSNNNKLHTRSV